MVVLHTFLLSSLNALILNALFYTLTNFVLPEMLRVFYSHHSVEQNFFSLSFKAFMLNLTQLHSDLRLYVCFSVFTYMTWSEFTRK